MRDTELILDQLPDATACPNRIDVAELGGTFFEESLEFGQLFCAEFRSPTWPRLWCHGVDAMLFDDGSPEPDGRESAAEDAGDSLLYPLRINFPPCIRRTVSR